MANQGTFTFRSPQQAQVFSVIESYYRQFRCVPSYRALCELRGWASLAASFKAVNRLIADGLLVKIETPGRRPMLVPVGVKVKNLQPRKSTKRKRLTDGTV